MTSDDLEFKVILGHRFCVHFGVNAEMHSCGKKSVYGAPDKFE